MTPPNDSPGRRFATGTLINRLLIFGFMVLVGYCLAISVQSRSIIGFVLALVSLGAGVYFIHLLTQARREMSKNEQS